MKENIKNVAMYIMAIIIIVAFNIAAAMLYFVATVIRFSIKFIEACADRVPIVIGAIAVFGKKLVKKLAAFFNKLLTRVKIYTAKAAYSVISTIREVTNNADCTVGIIKNKANDVVNNVKVTKKYISFKVDSIKARHGGSTIATIKTRNINHTIDWFKNNIHEAIEFRKAIMAECKYIEN